MFKKMKNGNEHILDEERKNKYVLFVRVRKKPQRDSGWFLELLFAAAFVFLDFSHTILVYKGFVEMVMFGVK